MDDETVWDMGNLVASLKLVAQSSVLLRWVTLFLLAVLAWQIGKHATLLLTSPVVPQLPVIAVEKSAPVSVSGDPSYLMGRPDVIAQKPTRPALSTDSVAKVSKTRLNLKLLGVIDLPKRGVAIIKSSGKTLVVAEGEEIIKGVELLEVFADQVMISHRGKREKLMMESAAKGLIESGSGKRASASAQSLSARDAQSLQAIGQTLRQSPLSISKYVRFKPIGKQGSWTAVKIWPKSNITLFRNLGLKSGDLIKEVNGRTIQQMSQQPALWQEFLNGSQVELTVERRGRSIQLAIDLN